MRRAQKQIDAALAQDLLDRVRAARPEFFERLMVNLLLSMGYGGSRTETQGAHLAVLAMMELMESSTKTP